MTIQLKKVNDNYRKGYDALMLNKFFFCSTCQYSGKSKQDYMQEHFTLICPMCKTVLYEGERTHTALNEPIVERLICLKCNYNNFLPRKRCFVCDAELVSFKKEG